MTALAAILAALAAGYGLGRWQPWCRLTRWADYRVRDDGRWWAANPLHAALFVATHPRGSLNAYRTRAPEEPTWAGATELASDREIARVAATGVVGYRQNQGRLHHCLAHKPAPASRWADFHEVGADDLDDGGICVHPDCGRDLLAAWPTTRAPEEPTR